MLKQITLKEAMERIERGEQVKCLRGPVGDWFNLKPYLLNTLLEDVIPLIDVPEGASENPTPAEPAAPAKSGSPSKPIDWGKVWALRGTGWTWKQIAQEMGISEAHIYAHKNDPEAVAAHEKYHEMRGGGVDAGD